MSSGPTVGRIVHYKSYGTPGGEYTPECRAAIVTGSSSEQDEEGQCLSLAILNPTGMFFNTHICHDEDGKGGTWHWPCKWAEDN